MTSGRQILQAEKESLHPTRSPFLKPDLCFWPWSSSMAVEFQKALLLRSIAQFEISSWDWASPPLKAVVHARETCSLGTRR
mmetsp:Transcript_2777/g.6507  ORF Transcript_2777/g.6507 Transcript_2777/m.6507 type:complete len:81 (-) Transcript_2777:155-397(-)